MCLTRAQQRKWDEAAGKKTTLGSLQIPIKRGRGKIHKTFWCLLTATESNSWMEHGRRMDLETASHIHCCSITWQERLRYRYTLQSCHYVGIHPRKTKRACFVAHLAVNTLRLVHNQSVTTWRIKQPQSTISFTTLYFSVENTRNHTRVLSSCCTHMKMAEE
jgi:hypothetical protein